MTKKKNKVKIAKLPRLFFKKKAYEFVRNLAELLSAGLTVHSSLESIIEETHSARLKKVIEGVGADIDEGISLAVSLKKRRLLNNHVLAFIELGEQSGKLVENLKLIVDQNEKEILFKSKINSALMYAVIVVLITLVVSVGISWFVLPQISDLYLNFEAELPLLTQALIWLGVFLAKYGYFLVPFFGAIVFIIFYFLFSFPKTKFVGHLLLFHLPLVNKLIKEVEISRMGYSLNSMMSAGIPLSQSLKSLPNTTTFNNYKKFYLHLKQKVEEGNSFQKSINLYPKVKKLIPMNVRQMIAAAEKSGTLTETFGRIGLIYERRVEVTSRNLPIILEPILLIIVGLGVALFVLGTMLPLYNLPNILI